MSCSPIVKNEVSLGSIIKPGPFSYKDILKKGIVSKPNVFNTGTGSGSGSESGIISSSSSRFSPNSNSTSLVDSSSDSETTIINFILSDSSSPILKCENMELGEEELAKSKKHKKSDDVDYLNPNWKLPGGKKYQKDGVRLENAFYNGLPKRIKNNISVNVKPKSNTGNVKVEIDMLYQSESTKRVISFEIKGVNPNTINNLERQTKLISQAMRQKTYLEENYSGYKTDCVFCFVTGNIKNKESVEDSGSEWKSPTVSKSKPILDLEFIKKIKSYGLNVAIGETPLQCAKNALLVLNLLR